MTERQKDEILKSVAERLYFYFIWGRMDLYDAYVKEFDKYLKVKTSDYPDYIIDQMERMQGEENISIVSVLYNLWRGYRSDFERETRHIKRMLGDTTEFLENNEA